MATDEPKLAAYLRETADAWNDSIESWTYVEQTPLARQDRRQRLLRADRAASR